MPAENERSRTAASAEAPTTSETDWRREVAHRLEAYRARRQRLRHDGSRGDLPSRQDRDASECEPGSEPLEVPESGPPYAWSRPHRIERVEIAVNQPESGSAGADEHHRSTRQGRRALTGSPLLAVATLGERKRAGMLDAVFVLLSFAGFLGLFRTLGGHLTFGKSDVAVYAAALAVFYAQYFALFTAFGGTTPGMMVRGLRVVSFDGSVPRPRQLLWRSFGYLVSGGTLLLGFLWAQWDDDHLTWHDRISQTYLTQEAPLTETGVLGPHRQPR